MEWRIDFFFAKKTVKSQKTSWLFWFSRIWQFVWQELSCVSGKLVFQYYFIIQTGNNKNVVKMVVIWVADFPCTVEVQGKFSSTWEKRKKNRLDLSYFYLVCLLLLQHISYIFFSIMQFSFFLCMCVYVYYTSCVLCVS